MEGTESLKKRLASWRQKFSRYQYVVLVALVGVALMLLPGRPAASEPDGAAAQTDAPQTADDFCRRLEAVLSQIDGAGEVACLLTWREGIRTIYQTDTTQSANGEVKVNTVLVSTGSGTEAAVTAGVVGPVYQGVIVVCDGADSAQLRLDMTRAVSALTGLSSDKIAVVKRKGKS